MADDVTILDGTGTPVVVATDEVVDATLGTAQVQYTKLMDGTLGGTNKSVVLPDGSFLTADADMRRLAERSLLKQMEQTFYSLLASESENSSRAGFEVR